MMANNIGNMSSYLRYLRKRRQVILQTMREITLIYLPLCYLPLLIPSSLGTWAYSVLFWNERKITNALGLIVCGCIFLMSLYAFLECVTASFKTRIVPYFKRHIEERNTFFAGQAIAENCHRLDKIAMEINLCPISEFGFNDDFEGEQVQWYEPEKGLETISRLLCQIRLMPGLVKKPESVISDLESMETALKKAVAKNIPFCFLLRTGIEYYAISETEQNRRNGFFS